MQEGEKLSFEQKRTIQYLEESAEAAKKGYMELKETIEDKDFTIEELREKIDQMRKLKNNKDNNEQLKLEF